jgi:hypothetical protein
MTIYYIPRQALFEDTYRQPDENDNKDDDDVSRVPCSRCGRETTFDPIYGDLCYRCCRAENE